MAWMFVSSNATLSFMYDMSARIWRRLTGLTIPIKKSLVDFVNKFLYVVKVMAVTETTV